MPTFLENYLFRGASYSHLFSFGGYINPNGLKASQRRKRGQSFTIKSRFRTNQRPQLVAEEEGRSRQRSSAHRSRLPILLPCSSRMESANPVSEQAERRDDPDAELEGDSWLVCCPFVRIWRWWIWMPVLDLGGWGRGFTSAKIYDRFFFFFMLSS